MVFTLDEKLEKHLNKCDDKRTKRAFYQIYQQKAQSAVDEHRKFFSDQTYEIKTFEGEPLHIAGILVKIVCKPKEIVEVPEFDTNRLNYWSTNYTYRIELHEIYK